VETYNYTSSGKTDKRQEEDVWADTRGVTVVENRT
jgi:hypothetical protein